MTRNDILRYFDSATDEQIKGLLDLNSADITRALDKRKDDNARLQSDLDAANQALAQARQTIQSLEDNKADAERLQAEIDGYKAAEERRKAGEKAARERAELMERMDAVLGDRAFIHERMRDLVADDFAKALADKANRGKSDADVFDAVTRDQGYFKSQNPPPPSMPGFGSVDPQVTDRASFLKLSFDDQIRFKSERPDQFKQIFHSGVNANG